jgi:hypothetical protein
LNTIIQKPGRGEVGDQGGYPPLLVKFVNFEKSYGLWGVTKLLAEGKSSKEIAELSYISRYTVRRHRDNIRRKLEIKGLVDLVRYAMEHGYISDLLIVLLFRQIPCRIMVWQGELAEKSVWLSNKEWQKFHYLLSLETYQAAKKF